MYDPSIWHISYSEASIRMLAALVLGGLIGIEREFGGHSAGFRTHILVCLGSAVIALLSIYGFAEFASEPNVRLDPARLAAQVISGIGFLGAGTIMRTGISVSGLTTAASLWVSAAIGLSIGAGFYYVAAISTLLVVMSLFALNKLERLFSRNKREYQLLIKVERTSSGLNHVVSHLGQMGIKIHKLAVENEVDGTEHDGRYLVVRVQFKLRKAPSYVNLISKLAVIEGVIGLETVGEMDANLQQELMK